MAHATPDWTREIMRRIRTVSHRTGREIAIMMDIKGPGNPDRGSRGAHRT